MSEIVALPTNNIPLTSEEKDMVDWLFPEKVVPPVAKPSKVKVETKPTTVPLRTTPPISIFTYMKIFAIILLFYVFNIPKFDKKIRNLCFTENVYVSTAFKTALFYTVLFTVSYFT